MKSEEEIREEIDNLRRNIKFNRDKEGRRLAAIYQTGKLDGKLEVLEEEIYSRMKNGDESRIRKAMEEMRKLEENNND